MQSLDSYPLHFLPPHVLPLASVSDLIPPPCAQSWTVEKGSSKARPPPQDAVPIQPAHGKTELQN